ncbi:MAG: metallophosphoesterase family protein [Candidatus Hydrogenedentales bacterium]|jgi:predicted phosphodiesterase
MIIAALGGVSGNLPALEAVLSHIDNAGIHTIVNTGDCLAGCPYPNEVMERLEKREVLSVQGEQDRQVLRVQRKSETLPQRVTPALFAALQFAHEKTLSKNLEKAAGLPRRRIFTVDGLSVCLCHGTPSSQSEGLEETDHLAKFRRQREFANVHVVVAGRTPSPFWKMVDDTLFVNPGRVGAGKPGRASYAIVSTEEIPWKVDIQEVAYDPSEVQKRLAELGLEWPN